MEDDNRAISWIQALENDDSLLKLKADWFYRHGGATLVKIAKCRFGDEWTFARLAYAHNLI